MNLQLELLEACNKKFSCLQTHSMEKFKPAKKPNKKQP